MATPHPTSTQRPPFRACGQARRNPRAGLTLLELSIASTIALALGTMMLQLFQTTTFAMGTVGVQSLLQQQLAVANAAISRDAQDARIRLTTACGGLSATGDTVTSLLLQVPSIDASGAIIGGFDEICYQYNAAPTAQTLSRFVVAGGGSARPNSSNVVARYLSNVSFSWFPAGLGAAAQNRVQVTLTVQRTERGRGHSQTVTVGFSLRNWPR